MQETTNWQDDAALGRFQMISPLLDPEMDNAKRIQLRQRIAENNGLAVRTIYRYEKGYREKQFAGLRPMNRQMRRSQRLPDNWDEIVGEAILQFGKFDAGYTDNGSEFISSQLVKSCARLGIKLFRAKPRRGESKGKIEKFHQVVDRFIAEVRIAKVNAIEELNRRWKIFLDQDYQKDPHDGIREYYKALDVDIPAEGISPLQEWNRDSRELVFIDAGTVGEAFLHHEDRTIDPAGCFSFGGHMYEASTAIAGATVEIAYDPLDTSAITVYYQDMDPIHAKRVTIGAYADPVPPIPVGMTDRSPETSRFLDALEKRYNEENRLAADAISFGSYRKEVSGHV